MTDRAQELADLRAQREQLELERSKRREQEDLDAELDAAKRALADEQAIDTAEREHGARKVAVVRTDCGVVIVKRPHVNTFRKFQDKGSTDSAAQDALVRPCLVHPTVFEFERICGEQPATLGQVASAVIRLAGFRAEDVAAK